MDPHPETIRLLRFSVKVRPLSQEIFSCYREMDFVFRFNPNLQFSAVKKTFAARLRIETHFMIIADGKRVDVHRKHWTLFFLCRSSMVKTARNDL